MIISVVRDKPSSTGTFGVLFIDGKFQCFTLEDKWRENKVSHETRIPCGSYQVGLRYSPKFSPKYGHDMLWIKDVPGYEYILFHRGNTAQNTSGCVLVGSGINGESLADSTLAYTKFYKSVFKSAQDGSLIATVIDYDRR